MDPVNIAILIGIVIVISLALAYFSNKDDEVTKKQKKSGPKQPIKKKTKKTTKRSKAVDFKYTGEIVDDDDQQMLDFLKGTEVEKAKEAKDAKKKKAKEDSVKQTEAKQNAKKTKAPTTTEEEDSAYVVIKKREKELKKKEESTEAERPAGKKGKRGGAEKSFFKSEEVPKPVKGAKKGPRVVAPVTEGESTETPVEGQEVRKRNVGPRQQGGNDEYDQPRRPREAPQAPPKPNTTGAYEAASLDDMLNSITNFYGTTANKGGQQQKKSTRVPKDKEAFSAQTETTSQ